MGLVNLPPNLKIIACAWGFKWFGNPSLIMPLSIFEMMLTFCFPILFPLRHGISQTPAKFCSPEKIQIFETSGFVSYLILVLGF